MFKTKLRDAMLELNLTQQQVCQLTGKSRGSVSQYLSGKQVPPDDAQEDIAKALGLAPDYFCGRSQVQRPKRTLDATGKIERLSVESAAVMLQMNSNTVRKGLQQGVFPWGYAVQTTIGGRWAYFINKKRFAETEGIELC